jgi:predicted DNA-binding transcriptional regulator AlpA
MEKAREYHFGAIDVNQRGLSCVEAAVYVGVSPSLFDAMVKDGRMPQPKRINSRTVWDRRRLDDAFEALPDGTYNNPWDRDVQ